MAPMARAAIEPGMTRPLLASMGPDSTGGETTKGVVVLLGGTGYDVSTGGTGTGCVVSTGGAGGGTGCVSTGGAGGGAGCVSTGGEGGSPVGTWIWPSEIWVTGCSGSGAG